MNRTRALLMAIIMAMLLQSPVWSRTITLEEALSSARDSNTDLAVAKVNLETAIRNSSPASSFIPDISIDGSISLDDMTGFGSSWGTLGGDLSLGISMELGTELITDTQIKAIEKESATLEYMLSADSIEEAVITSYWNIAFSRQNLESARMAEEDSREALASVEERYSAGACDELELLEARVAALEYSYERQEYEDSLSLAYTAFSELTGIDEEGFETEPVPDIPALSLPDADSLLELAVPGNLSIRSLRSKEELARTEVMDAKVRNQFPSVSLSASYHLGADQTVTEWEGLKSDRGSISIGFSIPISSYIPGSSGYLEVKEKEDSEKIAGINLQAGINDLYYSIRESLSQINQAENSISISETAKEAAERSYELAKERFNAGYITYDDLSDSRRDLLTAELNLAESRIGKLLGIYSLSFDTGMEVQQIIDSYKVEEEI